MSGNSVVFLKGARVALRPEERDDSPTLARWINDYDTAQYLGAHMPMTLHDQEQRYEGLSKRKPRDFAFVIVADDKPIGTMGLHRINWIDGTATTGAFIGEKDCRNKGYGSEAKMLLLNYAFHTLNLRKISSSVIAFNERSYAYSRKCGYKEEARLKSHIFRYGTYWDEIVLAVFYEDWLPLWKEFAKKHNIELPEHLR